MPKSGQESKGMGQLPNWDGNTVAAFSQERCSGGKTMNAKTLGMAWAIAVLAASCVLAQEVITTPAPVEGTKAGVAPRVPTLAAPAPDAAKPAVDDWRYRWHEGRWWYWTPENRWMWFSDDGHWVAFDADHRPPAVDNRGDAVMQPQAASPGPGYPYPAPGYYNPYPGYYYRGYYPGVAVGVWPYGNVGVGVGRRIGVDVWGPHGGVRVGRLYYGW
jgi:hypothetical protein